MVTTAKKTQVITGPAPEKAGTEIPGQSISEMLVLVTGLIPEPSCIAISGVSRLGSGISVLLVPKDCRSSGVKSILIAARCGENLEQQRAKVLSVKRQAGQFRMILSFILSIYILSVKQQALDKYIVMG